jgi:flavin-dependent dehydrogenase
MALVGDAAHVSTPMSGRGFTQALPAALRAFERRSLRPARELVISGRRFSRSFARSA